MKSLEIQNNTFGLRVFCSKCDRLYYTKTIGKCIHGKKSQTFKSTVYTSSGTTKSKHYDTMKYDEALMAAIQFKKDIKNGVLELHNQSSKTVLPECISIVDGANMFLNFKHGNNVPIHLKQNLSKHYLDSLEFYLAQFIEIMKSKGFNVNSMPVTKINELHVGYWADVIRKRYSEGSWDAPLRVLRLWINYMVDRQGVKMYNPFNDVKLVQVVNNVEAISKQEFEGVCRAVEISTPYQELNGKTKRKNRYRPYLLNAFNLALQTGLRREEFLSLTFDDIVEVNNEGHFMIITNNIKVERITGKKYKKKFIPVNEDLMNLLLELGWQEKRGSKEYIIAPNRKASLKTMMAACTKGFTHYFNQAFPNKKVKNLKVLRKTYLSYLGRELGEDVVHFSSHSGMKVLEDHYFDKRIVAKAIKVKIFS